MDTDFSMHGMRHFDDPFLLPSSSSMPEQLEPALDMCLFLYFLNPQYRQASIRVTSHFITDFDYPGTGDQDEKDKLDDFVHYKLQLPSYLNVVGQEWSCYGNSFCRVHFPFDRFLVDSRGKTPVEYSLARMGQSAKFHWQKMQYEIPDPRQAGKTVCLPFRDYPAKAADRIHLCRINPRRVFIRYNRISGSKSFIYRFESDLIDDVKKGRRHIVDEIPIDMLKAIRHNQDFLFAPDQIYHFHQQPVSGVSDHGWGLPGVIANYRNLHQLQVYRKIDEAVGLDYLLPFRLFSPVDSANPNDMMNNMLLSRWAQEMDTIIRNRRKDKFAMHAVPFPVNYQEFGAKGKELTPKDLIEWQTNATLDGMGYPQELFKGTLAFDQIPTALRLFESSFDFIPTGFNNLAKWIVKRVRAWQNQPEMNIELQKPSLADSLEIKQMMLQLSAQGEISRERAWKSLGITKVVDEVEKRIEEDAEIQKKKIESDAELKKQVETGTLSSEQSDPQGGGAAGSSPSGGGGAGQTPVDTSNDADSLAQYWLSIPSDGDRTKAMQATRAQNENLYALAKDKMEQMRRGGASQGRGAVAQQAQQQGPPSGGTTTVGPGGG